MSSDPTNADRMPVIVCVRPSDDSNRFALFGLPDEVTIVDIDMGYLELSDWKEFLQWAMPLIRQMDAIRERDYYNPAIQRIGAEICEVVRQYHERRVPALCDDWTEWVREEAIKHGISGDEYEIPDTVAELEVEQLRRVLNAEWEYSEGAIDDSELQAINAIAAAILGQGWLDVLAETCTAERWSPSDMHDAASDITELARLFSRINTKVNT